LHRCPLLHRTTHIHGGQAGSAHVGDLATALLVHQHFYSHRSGHCAQSWTLPSLAQARGHPARVSGAVQRHGGSCAAGRRALAAPGARRMPQPLTTARSSSAARISVLLYSKMHLRLDLTLADQARRCATFKEASARGSWSNGGHAGCEPSTVWRITQR